MKCIALVTNCGLRLETAMVPTVNMGWQLFTNDKYWKSCVFPKDLKQYLSRYNLMIQMIFQMIDTAKP